MLGNSGNFGKHLRDHANKFQSKFLPWIIAYNLSKKTRSKYFKKNTLDLVIFFISSNLSLTHLRNPHLLKIIKIDIPCDKSFNRKILPEILFG